MHLNKIFLLIVVSAFLVSCASVPPAPTASDKVLKIASPPPHHQIHEVPRGSYVIAIDDQAGQAILGNPEFPRLVFFNLSSGKSESIDVPIVPRLALKLGEDGGLAVFGHETQMIPSSKFLIWREGKVFVCELTEPIRVWHGLVWREKRQLILGDQESDTLVFIDIDRILKAVGQYSIKVPIGRYVLEGEPNDFELVSKGHLALSYAELGYVEILDLYKFNLVDRVKRRDFAYGLLLASLPSKFDYDFFTILNGSGVSVDLFKLPHRKAGFKRVTFQESTLVKLETSLYSQSEWRDGQAAVFKESSADETLWLGYKNRLFVYKLIQLRRSALPFPYASLQLVYEKKLPLDRIGRIDFFDGHRKVAISSPSEGLLLISPVEVLLGW